jgi:hypothetical protein
MGLSKPHWLIRGYDGLDLIFEKRIASELLSEKQVEQVLRALTAKAGLTFDEIVEAHLKRRTRAANDLLIVKRPGPELRFFCGENPHFAATHVHGKPTLR